MISLSVYEFVEIIVGIFFIWIGIYVVTRDPFSKLSWLTFLLIVGFGLTIFSDSILLQTQNLQEYTKWQKITDWPLFVAPVFFYHISLVINENKKDLRKNILIIVAYTIALIFYGLDVKGGLILKETALRYHNFRRMDGFEPGILLLPSIGFVCLMIAFGAYNFFLEIKKGFWQYFLPGLSGLVFIATGFIVALSYYVYLAWANFLFSVGISISLLLFIWAMIRYHLFGSTPKVFDRAFMYRTVAILFILLIYLVVFLVSGTEISFPVYTLIILSLLAILLTHSFYEWFSTFINDLLYNPSSGLSVVNDQEVSDAIKNYNSPDRLENSSLLRLAVVAKKRKEKEAPVDGLRQIIKDAIQYFKPEENSNRRTKRNLKYHLLTMIAFDQAGEGQILWELGFEEYPVRIMTREVKARPPIFKSISPSDYTYLSRNAFIALKKEAIHDVTWRISYLEKNAH